MSRICLVSLWLMLTGWVLPTGHQLALGAPVLSQSAEPKPAKKDRYVTYFEYKGEQIPKHRTPAKKLKGGGAVMIRELEELLDQGHSALLATTLEPVLSSHQRSRIALVQLQVRAARPKWNHEAYEREFGFYQREDAWREARRQQLAQDKHERELALQRLLVQKAKRAADSTARIRAYRWRVQQDSLQAVAARNKARQDSVEAVAEAEASSTRFVNATKLKLRDEPTASAQARAVVLLGSSVEVLEQLPSGWWQVYVEGYQGYLRKEFLVPTLDAITVPGANIAGLKEAEGSAYIERIVIKPQARGKRKVYICAGQYAYAYHSRNICAGLNNCRAGVYYTTEYKAQDMGRSPCGRCFD